MSVERRERFARTAGAEDAPFQATRALCNHCGRLGDAQIVFRGSLVILVKWCLDHGRSEALICSDRDWYLQSLSYLKPGTNPLRRAVARNEGCPGSCGLCPEHLQHTCVPILEITNQCDLRCPACLVHGSVPKPLSLDDARRLLDGLVASEGRLNMLTLSGGEPTQHPQLLEIVDACLRPEVGIVSLSTNGVRLAEDESLLAALCERGVVISLQFDGVRPETYRALRGRPDLAPLKLRLIDRVIARGGRLSLTVTLARGVNEDELPEVLRLLFSEDAIASVMVQPLAHAGRARSALAHDPMRSLTIPEVIGLLSGASGAVLEPADFTPLPCSHPSCFALTYLLKVQGGRLVSLPKVVEAATYLDLIKNQALLRVDPASLEKLRDTLYAIWSGSGQIPEREAVLRTLKRMLVELNRLGQGASLREVLELGVQNVKSIFIHHFMDRATFDLSRAVKCCNHYPQVDGRLLPACVRNNVPSGPARPAAELGTVLR
jgi:uncharacterized radical SAM superfamily Fe-S cluster-containing enzyme